MALADIANQMSEQLLAASNASATFGIQFAAVVGRQQMTDVVEYPSDATESLAHVVTSAANLRGAQGPIQPPTT